MNPVSTMAMKHAAWTTKIQRSSACARGVPDSRSGRRSFNKIGLATVAIAIPLRWSATRHCYTFDRERQTHGSLVAEGELLPLVRVDQGDRPARNRFNL